MHDRVYPVKRQAPDTRDMVSAFVDADVELPIRMDLRNLNPAIFNQYTLGSCSANAGVAAKMMLESQTKQVPITNIPLLSRLFLYYQERNIEGNIPQDAGACMRSICKALNKFGVCEERYSPYIMENFAVEPSAEAITDALNHTIGSYKALYSIGDIKKYIAANNLPVLIGMDVYESFDSDEVETGKYAGHVPIPNKDIEKYLGGHAVLVVGYDDDMVVNCKPTTMLKKLTRCLACQQTKGALIVRNSWGEEWGDKGYFYLPYEFVTRGFAFDFWTLTI